MKKLTKKGKIAVGVAAVLLASGVGTIMNEMDAPEVSPSQVIETSVSPSTLLSKMPLAPPETSEPSPSPAVEVSASPSALPSTAPSEPPATPEPSPSPLVTQEPTITPETSQVPTVAPEISQEPSQAPSASPSPSPEATPQPTRIHGWLPDTTVYVSKRGIIHLSHTCSGMKRYTEMTLERAYKTYGDSFCENCW